MRPPERASSKPARFLLAGLLILLVIVSTRCAGPFMDDEDEYQDPVQMTEAVLDAIEAAEATERYLTIKQTETLEAKNIWAFVVSSSGSLEDYGIGMIGLVHLGDQVTLKGPITIRLRTHRHETDGDPGIPVTDEQIQIASGETWTYYLEEASSLYPGNWDAVIELVSVNW